jgi:hypothetical protein
VVQPLESEVGHRNATWSSASLGSISGLTERDISANGRPRIAPPRTAKSVRPAITDLLPRVIITAKACSLLTSRLTDAKCVRAPGSEATRSPTESD